MSELPKGWATTTLGEIGRYLNGRGFKKSEWRESGRPIIRIQNLTGTSDVFNYFDGEAEDRNVVRPGDLLISWAATLGVFVWRGPEAVLNQHIFKVESRIDPAFHRYLVAFVLDDLRRQTHGSGMMHITKARFDGTPVGLPPLAEQWRIVAVIEEQFSRLDAAEESRRRAQRNLVRFRGATLLEAFDGEWPQRELASLTDPERPVRYGILMPKEDVDHGVLYVRVKDFPKGTIDLAGLRRTSFEIAEKYRRATLRAGDVLLSIRGTYGRVAIVPPELEGGNITQDTARIAPLSELDAQYLAAYLRSEAAQRYFQRVARGVAVKGVNIGDLRVMPIPVPPLDEQRRIVAEVERQLSLVDALAAAVESALRRSATLRRAILARAFAGELVPQDPSDEPASALLERIAAERADAPRRVRARARS